MVENKNFLTELHKLYADSSKHSTYQNIPQFIRDALGYTETINETWRGDSARWEYIQNQLNFESQKILDVGANTGFFTLSLAHRYPDSIITAMEGNVNHAEFINLIIKYFLMKNVRVLSQYLDFSALGLLGEYDTILLFNIMHHAGVDFDLDLIPSQKDLFGYLVLFMKKLGEHSRKIVYQMGYNWGGDKRQPVVVLHDDAGKCLYTCHFLRQAGWKIDSIAITYASHGAIPVLYKNVPQDIIFAANVLDEKILREGLCKIYDPMMTSFSEFYRRPIFICSKD